MQKNSAIKYLSDKLNSTLSSAISNNEKIFYFDYPVHENLGDLLIYLGTVRWFEKVELEVGGSWNYKNFTYPELPKSHTIVCHGGGNFGDLYAYQNFRESLVTSYPDNKIVMLPQSLHFEKPENLAKTSEILNAHRDLHLFFRDTESLDIARSRFEARTIDLAPDMAYFLQDDLGAIRSGDGGARRYKTVYLLRKDIEASGQTIEPDPERSWTGDWDDALGGYVPFIRAIRRVNGRLGKHMPAGLFERAWRATAWRLALRSAGLFRDAERVVTSRLHGHILANLMGVPNMLIDNSYGKNRKYFETWHKNMNLGELYERKNQ